MSEVFDYCLVTERTDVGCKRSANEDWLAHFTCPNGLVAVICDGMGGHVGGKTASHTAVDAIQHFMMRESPLSPQDLIVEAIKAANDAVLYKASQHPELKGMGATCVMLLVRNGKVYIGSVGDSRVYLNRAHTLRQLTKDQSFVQTLVDSGAITPEQAERHPRKNEITNAIGLANMQPATVLPNAFIPEAGDCFLLCSDGLSGMVSDDEICKIVSRKSNMSQQERVDELVKRAKNNGGLDNITCQLIEFPIAPPTQSQKEWWKSKYVLTAVTAVFILMAATCGWFVYNSYQTKDGQENTVNPNKNNRTTTNMDSAYRYLKPITSKKNYKFLELVEFNGGIKVRSYLNGKQDTVINLYDKSLSIKQLNVKPKDSIEIHYPEKDSTQCSLTLKKDLNKGQEIHVILRGDKNKRYQFVIPVISPNISRPEQVDNEKGSDTMTERILNAPGNPSALSAPDCTLYIPDSTYIYINYNGKVNDEYVKLKYNVSIECSHDFTQGLEWANISRNDGRTCIIKITSLPKEGGTIKIPVKGIDANGNDLEEIILRLHLKK